jgi:hypothetical protein
MGHASANAAAGRKWAHATWAQAGVGNTIATDVVAFSSWRASSTTQMLMCEQK